MVDFNLVSLASEGDPIILLQSNFLHVTSDLQSQPQRGVDALFGVNNFPNG